MANPICLHMTVSNTQALKVLWTNTYLDVIHSWYQCSLKPGSPDKAQTAFYAVNQPQMAAVMLSPRDQSGLEANILASASRFWPRSGLDLIVLLCNRAFFVQKLCKIREFC